MVNGPTIHGYDPATGEELWSVGPNSELVIATPVAGDGVVYVSAGYAPIKPIYAVRLGSRGRFEVEPGTDHERLAWSHDRGGAYMPTPLLYEGLLYVVHHNGRIVAYDAAGGAAIYKARFSRGGTFTASPVAANGKLYAPTEEGQVYVIEAGPEYREIAVNEMDDRAPGRHRDVENVRSSILSYPLSRIGLSGPTGRPSKYQMTSMMIQPMSKKFA